MPGSLAVIHVLQGENRQGTFTVARKVPACPTPAPCWSGCMGGVGQTMTETMLFSMVLCSCMLRSMIETGLLFPVFIEASFNPHSCLYPSTFSSLLSYERYLEFKLVL